MIGAVNGRRAAGPAVRECCSAGGPVGEEPPGPIKSGALRLRIGARPTKPRTGDP
jgi:hypothetical protein